MFIDVLVEGGVSGHADRYQTAASNVGDGCRAPMADDRVRAGDFGLQLGVVQQAGAVAVDRGASGAVLDEHLMLRVLGGKNVGPAHQSLEGMEVGADCHQEAAHSSGPTRTEPG
jgi:hypothetical protein